jgi:coenzyme PQQ precursor peptide PqqA
LPASNRIAYTFAHGVITIMNDWKTPEFVEVRMDAEINCYSSALPETGKVRIPNRPVIDGPTSDQNPES